jgi:hypothetical protein
MAPEVKKLDQQTIIDGFSSRIWLNDRRNKFHYRDPKSEELIEFSETLLKEFVAAQGFYSSILEYAEKETGAPLKNDAAKRLRSAAWLKLLGQIVKDHRVDFVGELAGYPPGEHTVNGTKILISRGYKLIEPSPGDPSFILTFFREFLPHGQDCYAHTWLLDRYEGLRHPEKYTPGQALIIGGKTNDGKTLFKRRILRPLLGGRGTDAISYLIGDDGWNDDLAKAELWEVDDQGDTRGFDRYTFANNIKKAVADPDLRIRTRYLSAVTIPLKIAIIILFNLEARHYALIPENTGDIEDKTIILKSAKATLPKDSTEIEREIAKALPAYAYWLLHEFQVPAGIRTVERFHIAAYKEPEILEAIQETSPAALLGELLQQFVEELPTPQWKDFPSRIYSTLLTETSWRARLEKICRSFGRFVQLLSELAKQKGSGVTFTRSHGKRRYKIERLRPQPTKAANVVTMNAGSKTAEKDPDSKQKNRPTTKEPNREKYRENTR